MLMLKTLRCPEYLRSIALSSHRSQIGIQPGKDLPDELGPWRDMVGLVKDELLVFRGSTQKIEGRSYVFVDANVGYVFVPVGIAYEYIMGHYILVLIHSQEIVKISFFRHSDRKYRRFPEVFLLSPELNNKPGAFA
jgi:hypothetical protein